MPIQFKVIDGTVRTTMTGVVTPTEVLAHLRDLGSRAGIPDVFVEVVDLSAVDNVNIVSTDARQIAQQASALHSSHHASHVIVVATDPLSFGVSRMLDAYVTMQNPTCRWYSLKSMDDVPAVLESIRNEMAGGPEPG